MSQTYRLNKKKTIEIFNDDTFITSYPKSGNTWARFFISNILLDDDSTDLINIDQQVPDIYKVENHILENIRRPRFLKSHQPYTPFYPRVLYLVRDVRAVVMSYYRQRLRMGVIPPGLPILKFTEMFVDGSVTQFGPWDKHAQDWITQNEGNADSFMLVRYEDMINNGLEEFRKITAFLHLTRSDQQIEAAYLRSSFTRMRALEERAGTDWLEKKRAKNLSIPFMYSGKAYSWTQELDTPSKQLLADRYGPTLTLLGYDV